MPAIPTAIAAFDKVGIYSLLPPLFSPYPPGSCTECVASKITG